jgi:zinc and cadmium transporter
MTLVYIVLATLLGTLLSVGLAAGLSAYGLGRVLKHGVSFSTGLLLSTALLNILPEAFEAHHATSPTALFATLMAGLLAFFLLEKTDLYRHNHHHEGDAHHHHHGFDRHQAGRGGWSVLIGDGIHNFCDGVIIAAAFSASTKLGVLAALAIVAHEIPQEIGNFLVLCNAGFSRRRALCYNLFSGLASVLGGVLGFFALGPWQNGFPYLLTISASSLLYVAMADLIPQLQHPLDLRDTLLQVMWLGAGLGLIALISAFAPH